MSSTYTFEELAAAAASSSSISESVRRLGREPTPKRNRYITGLMLRHGIDCEHLRIRAQRYTREMLAEAAAASNSIAEVVRRLGAKEVGGTQYRIGRRLRHYEIDISHFESLSQRRRRRRLKDVPQSEFVDAIVRARSIAAVARALDVSDGGGFRARFREIVAAHGLNLPHMLGQGHARGKRGPRRLEVMDLLVAEPTSRPADAESQARASGPHSSRSASLTAAQSAPPVRSGEGAR